MPGCPIRKPPDQFVFADPRSLSQLITSFFASKSQGILHAPLITFFLFPDSLVGSPNLSDPARGQGRHAAFAPHAKNSFFEMVSFHYYRLRAVSARPRALRAASICCHTFDFTTKSGSRVFINMSKNVLLFLKADLLNLSTHEIQFFLFRISIGLPFGDPVKPVEGTNQPVRSASEPTRSGASSSVCRFAYKNLTGFCRLLQTAGLVWSPSGEYRIRTDDP